MAKKINEADLDKLVEFGTDVWNHLISPLGEGMKEIEDYIGLNDLHRGRILNCSLVLAHMVNRYMLEKGLATKKELHPLNGLKFDQKLQRLKKQAEPSFSRGLIDGMKAINVIRNNYAHRLDFMIKAEHLSRIEHMNDKDAYRPFDPAAEDYAVRTIENYTRIACSYMLSKIGPVKSGLDNLWSTYPKFKTFVDRFDGDMFAPIGQK